MAIRILHFPINPNYTNTVNCIVTQDANGIKFEFSGTRLTKAFNKEIYLDFESNKSSIIQLTIQDGIEQNELVVRKIFDVVDKNSMQVNTAISPNDIVLGRIVFNADCSDIVIFIGALLSSNTFADFESIELELNGNSSTGILMEYSPFFNSVMQERIIKSKMINEVDIYASVTYLESQVDILSKALFMVLSAIDPKIKDLVFTNMPELTEYETSFNNTSVLTVKSISKCIDEMDTNKAKLRKLQVDYYAAKK